MKLALTLLLAGSVVASAQAPRKDPLSKYRQLWEKSLVTIPPPPEEVAPVEKVTELDDYVLGGWSQTSAGYVVSLINSKDPKARITIAPGMPNKGGYKVLEVERDPMNYKATKLLIQVGVDKKWIGYEDKFLTLQQPPAARTNNAPPKKPTSNNQQKPPLPVPAKTNNTKPQNTQRQPRVRRVPVPPKK